MAELNPNLNPANLAALPNNLVGRFRTPELRRPLKLTDDEDLFDSEGSGVDDWYASGDGQPDPENTVPDPDESWKDPEERGDPVPTESTTTTSTTTSTSTTTTTTTTTTTSTTTTTTTTSTSTSTTTTSTTKSTSAVTEPETTTDMADLVESTTVNENLAEFPRKSSNQPKGGDDCYAYYRVHLNLGASVSVPAEAEWNYDESDPNHEAFLEISDTLMEELENRFDRVKGEQEITPIQIKDREGSAYVYIDIGCPIINGCDDYDIDQEFRSILDDGTLGQYTVMREGYQFYPLGTWCQIGFTLSIPVF